MLIRCTVGISMCTGDYGQIKPEISQNGFLYLSIGRNCGAVSTPLVLTALHIVQRDKLAWGELTLRMGLGEVKRRLPAESTITVRGIFLWAVAFCCFFCFILDAASKPGFFPKPDGVEVPQHNAWTYCKRIFLVKGSASVNGDKRKNLENIICYRFVSGPYYPIQCSANA